MTMTNEKAGELRAALELAREAKSIGCDIASAVDNLKYTRPEEEREHWEEQALNYRRTARFLLEHAQELSKRITGEDLKDADEEEKEQFGKLMKLLQIEIK